MDWCGHYPDLFKHVGLLGSDREFSRGLVFPFHLGKPVHAFFPIPAFYHRLCCLSPRQFEVEENRFGTAHFDGSGQRLVLLRGNLQRSFRDDHYPHLDDGLDLLFRRAGTKKWAYQLLILVPLLTILAISIPQGIKLTQRLDDLNFGARLVEGNGVELVWAPRGPGWPDKGTSWEDAQRICTYLSEDGTQIMPEPQNIWRLPTVDEAVRSMMLHGENAGGFWDPLEEKAVYERTPDKESPLWDVHSKVIYYWTADTSLQDKNRAYIIVYHGGVFERFKTESQPYLSFRAVREVAANN